MKKVQGFYLHNAVDKKTYYEMVSEAAFRKTFESLSAEDQQKWYVWTNDSRTWQPAVAICGPGKSARLGAAKNTLADLLSKTEVVQPDKMIHLKSDLSKERREVERFPIRLKGVIIFGQTAYRTFTGNISNGGALFESRLPDLMRADGLEYQICISHFQGSENLHFKARLVESCEKASRFQFTETADLVRSRLSGWLSSAGKQHRPVLKSA